MKAKEIASSISAYSRRMAEIGLAFDKAKQNGVSAEIYRSILNKLPSGDLSLPIIK